ncbi:hypothetical protein EDB85DRAFT_2158862 [Lactarius pseudohatsudake]|nr:hypothetical protein EDB85DRAFT_2158862 [Lactarius pseudohatsudake]
MSVVPLLVIPHSDCLVLSLPLHYMFELASEFVDSRPQALAVLVPSRSSSPVLAPALALVRLRSHWLSNAPDTVTPADPSAFELTRTRPYPSIYALPFRNRHHIAMHAADSLANGSSAIRSKALPGFDHVLAPPHCALQAHGATSTFGCAQEPPSSSAATRLYDCDREPHAMAGMVCRTLQHRRCSARYDSDGALHITTAMARCTLRYRRRAAHHNSDGTLHAARYDADGTPHSTTAMRHRTLRHRWRPARYHCDGAPHATTPMRCRTLRHRRCAARYESIGVPHSTTPTARRTPRQHRRAALYDTDGAPHATTATVSRMLQHRRRAAYYDSNAASHATTPGFTQVRVQVEQIYPGVTHANHYLRGRTTKAYVIQ